jgi:hypothetical protein
MATKKTGDYGHSLEELTTMLKEGDECDKEDFAEKRSNVLLVAGDHYVKRQSTYHRRIRDSKDLSGEQKLRLTKNHIQKITKTYANNIVSMNPGVGFKPKNEGERQDQKAAELHHAVWRDAVDRYEVDSLVEDWCDDFVSIGEVAVKIFWDPMGGEIKAYNQEIDKDGTPLFDEAGNPLAGEPVYSGAMVFEPIHGFNLLRDKNAKKMKDSPWFIYRKMVDVDDLIKQFPDHEKKIQASMDETFVVFDAKKGGFAKAEGQVMLLEAYFRPCLKYPRGYFCFFTQEAKLVEGELPGSIFPIVWEGFDFVQTTPRAMSPVKIMRPYQAEINRAASKMAEHQITLGDDKIVMMNGSKMTQSTVLPGIRGINVTGGEPVILSGRDGSQYLQYMESQIAEMYDVMNVMEDSVESKGQLDPLVLIFRSGSQKKKFRLYIKRFERFLINVCKTYLRLAKIYLSDEAVIYAVGRSERVNIQEYKNSEDLCYQITIEAQSDDIEDKLGQQLMLNHALQYVGNKLEREDIGKIMRAMPYSNMEESFKDLTLDYDCATNDILALDRGESPVVHEFDNHRYTIKRLVSRMREADFRYLPPEIQQKYMLNVQLHEQYETMQLRKLRAAEADFIPTSGALIRMDVWVPDPTSPTGKTKRAEVPYDAVTWLIQRLEDQGSTLEQMSDMNQGAQAQIADQYSNSGGGMQGPQNLTAMS